MKPNVAAMALSSNRCRIVAYTGTFAVYTFEHIVILWWRKEAVLGGVNATARAFKLLIGENAQLPIGLLTLIDAECDVKAPPPVRNAVAELLEIHNQRIGAAAICYQASGFKATVMRSVITAINLASRNTFPNKVFPDVVTASSWLALTLKQPGLAGKKIEQAVAEITLGREPGVLNSGIRAGSPLR